MRLLILVITMALGLGFSAITSTDSHELEAGCSPQDHVDSNWISVLRSTALDAGMCMQVIDPREAFEVVSHVDQLETVSYPVDYSTAPFSVTFVGQGVPDAVEVGARYGGTNGNYIPVTTCLAPDVTRLDGLPKNDTCEVLINDAGYYQISFSVSERFDNLEQLTLLVHQVKPDPQPGELLADVYQYVIALDRED